MAVSLSALHGPERVDGKQTVWGCYAQHRRDAKKRCIDFLLSFDEWLEIWKKSGQLANRGSKIGQYVMARFGDTGPYSLTNVKIITAAQNHHEANIGSKRPKSPEHRLKMSNILRGRKLTKKHCEAISLGNKGKLKGIPKSEETKRKMSLAKKGKKLGKPSAKHRLAISRRLYGVPKTEKHCAAMREGQQLRRTKLKALEDVK